jgi:signal transduction histidine kinase
VGLSVCKKIIEQIGGTVHAVSTYGQGSTFEFKMRAKNPKKL